MIHQGGKEERKRASYRQECNQMDSDGKEGLTRPRGEHTPTTIRDRTSSASQIAMRRLREIGCHISVSEYPVGEVLRYARLLDRLGFDHMRVGDHTTTLNPKVRYPNSQAILSTIGALTRRIRIMTAVTDPFRRHPVEIAQWIATEDYLTGGRVSLGIGAGEKMNLAPFGIEYDKPVTRLREAIEVIKLLWKATPDRPAKYQGKIFHLDDAYVQFLPVQKPHPPIYVGALGRTTRALAGEVADGWITTLSESPEMLRQDLVDVERGLKASRRKIPGFEVVAGVYTDISKDRESVYREMWPMVRSGLVLGREALKRYAEIDVPEDLSTHGAVLTKDTTDRIAKMAAIVPSDLVERITPEIAAVGDAEDCIATIERYLDAGATSITICNISKNKDRVYRAYSREIIPYLRKEYGEN
jgi:alkanesulfonate monooxygenase SsuD/methylene tetrahydromethanopterin reductase-like flavin-dependent oxidoreductase (luciferase family)